MVVQVGVLGVVLLLKSFDDFAPSVEHFLYSFAELSFIRSENFTGNKAQGENRNDLAKVLHIACLVTTLQTDKTRVISHLASSISTPIVRDTTGVLR